MKTATITQMKNQLSSFIDMVKHGETVLILDRTVPVAMLESPTPRERAECPDALGHLERSGLLRRGKSALPKAFFKAKLPCPAKGASVVKALLRDREEGR